MQQLNVGVIGAGAMGAFHAETIARRVPGARLGRIADADGALAERVSASLDCARWTADAAELLADPDIDAVIIAAPARFHAELIVAATSHGKAVFCEKPIANELADADRAIEACRAAGVPLQIGFQRRFDRGFRAARELVERGDLGSVHLLRSITRDPKLDHPERTPRWAIFRETLIHDFDVLRYLNPGAEAVEVFAWADALVKPDWKERGLRDTAVATVRFTNGALAAVDASFETGYGYDVRAEVFGSSGMATVGDGRRTSMTHYGSMAAHTERVDWFLELFGEAYTAEVAHFVRCVREGSTPACTGEDGRAALAMALAAIQSAENGKVVKVDA